MTIIFDEASDIPKSMYDGSLMSLAKEIADSVRVEVRHDYMSAYRAGWNDAIDEIARSLPKKKE